MKRTLAKQTVQDWSLLGLKPMHRALVRRCVEQTNAVHQRTLQGQRKVAWSLDPWDWHREQSLLPILDRTGILIIECKGLLERAKVVEPIDPFLVALQRRSNAQIRLVWNWTLQGKKDLQWCTEMSFDGVVHDARSLMTWLPICLRHGKSRERQLNSLLRDIELPPLITPKTSPNSADLPNPWKPC